MRARAQNGSWYDGVEFLIQKRDPSGQIFTGKSIEMEPLDIGMQYDPTFRLDRENAQKLFNDLWHCGLRPTDGTGDVGQLKATQSHLHDMKAIAFHALNIKGNND